MNKQTKLYKALKEGLISFDGAHAIHTPRELVEEILGKITLAGEILVMFNIEFVISLVYNYNINPNAITFYSDHKTKSAMATRLGVKYITKLETHMKFDVVIGNPPYLQGTWRTFMQRALDMSNRYVLLVSPDGTITTSKKYSYIRKMLEEGGVQSVTPCHHYFPNIITSSEISFYIFDKTLPYNPVSFNKKLSKNEILALGIIERVKNYKARAGGLTQTMAVGKKDTYAVGKIDTIVGVTKSGVIVKKYLKSDVKIIENGINYFFTNKFFGMNPDDNVFETNNKIGVVDDNIYYIGRPADYTVADFKRIYFSKIMRFVLAHYRGTNRRTLGWHIEELPLISPTVTDLYKHFNLTQEEIDYVEANVK